MTDSILYALSDWYKNDRVHSLTIYRGKNGNLELVAKSKHGKIVYRKRVRLFAKPEPVTQLWWGWHRPTIEEAFATAEQVDAYFSRISKRGKGDKRTKGRINLEQGLKEVEIPLI